MSLKLEFIGVQMLSATDRGGAPPMVSGNSNKGMARFNGLWNLDQPLDKYVAMTLFFLAAFVMLNFRIFS
jgi:hypothetical protein